MSATFWNKESGRVRLRHWGERTLDLDLLIYAEEKNSGMNLNPLTPCWWMERDFVLIPLLDLDPIYTLMVLRLKLLPVVNNPR